MGSLQPNAGGFAVTGMDYNSGILLSTASSATGTLSTGANSPFTGTYLGAYLDTSGPSAPDAGTVMLTVNPNGIVTGTTYDSTLTLRAYPISGTISSDGTLAGSPFSGLLSQNSTTHVFSLSYTESDGTKGVLTVGLAPPTSTLAGSYSGTFSNSAGVNGTAALTITSGGAVKGGFEAGANSGNNSIFYLDGYVDRNGTVYLAYISIAGGVRGTSVGGFTLTGTSLNGTLQETNTDGTSPMDTLVLTKQ